MNTNEEHDRIWHSGFEEGKKQGRREVVERQASIGIGEGPVESDPIWFKLPWKLWQALRREALEE